MAHHSGKQRQPLEEALAQRLAARRESEPARAEALRQLGAVDRAAYDAVAHIPPRATRSRRSPAALACAAGLCGANIVALIPLTPGGLGIVEADLASLPVLAGVPSGPAFVATLAYRLVCYWLPVLIGGPAHPDVPPSLRGSLAAIFSTSNRQVATSRMSARARAALGFEGGCRTLDPVSINGKNHDGFIPLTGIAAWKTIGERDSCRR